MGVDSFAFTYEWPAIAANLPSNGRASGGAPSTHTGDDQGTPLSTGGGLVDTSPLSDTMQAAVDAIVAQLAIRDRDLTDYLQAWLQISHTSGTLNGSGAALAAHQVVNADRLVISVSAWYRSSAGVATPLTITAVDGTDVHLAGGVAGAPYRCTLVFSTVVNQPW